mgnify:CR=1 FL=1
MATEADIRRAALALPGAVDFAARSRIAADVEALSRRLKEVMTRSPICVRADAVAVEALRIFNERNIDDLIVVNERREPVGLVDSQDLPKFKLM